ncbi:MAG: Ran-binding zinc finger domain-containing protein [Eubacteriales bacterium]
MKCPKCGAYNKAEYKKCYVCSTLLPQEYIEEKKETKAKNSMWTQAAFRPEDETDETKEERKALFDIENLAEEVSPEEKKHYSVYQKREQAKERGIWGDEKSTRYTRWGQGNVPVVALEDESEKQVTKKRKRGSKYAVEPLSKNAQRIRNFREGQEIGIVVPPEPKREEPKKRDNRPTKKTYKKKLTIKWSRLILVSLLSVIILFGLILGIVSLTGKISESMSQLFAPRNQLPNNGQPLVERVLKDGQTWHTITFYGEDGDKVLVEDESHNIKRTLTIHDSRAVLSLDDYSYIPIEGEEFYGDEFTYVELEAYYFDKDGNETVLEVPKYRISVPLAPLTIVSPTEQGKPVDTTQVLIRVKVEKESRVLIGGKNMSGNVDDEGYTSTYISLDESGINEIPVRVQLDGYRENNYGVLVYREPMDVYIKLTDAPTQTQSNIILINGFTEPGATVTLDDSMPLLIDYIEVKSNGSFYVKTELSDFGENPLILHVTTPDGRSATLKHIIYRIPLEGAYTGSAWLFDYNALTSAATKMIGQVYKMTGTVEERIETPEAKLFLFNAGTAEEPKNVIIQYNGLYDLQTDIVYDIYADVLGQYDNRPYLYARFVYVSDDSN